MATIAISMDQFVLKAAFVEERYADCIRFFIASQILDAFAGIGLFNLQWRQQPQQQKRNPFNTGKKDT